MKGKSIKVLSLIGFIGSGIISFLLASTLCNTYFEYFIAALMTLVMQASSYYFMKESIQTKSILYGTLAVALFSISIVGTLAYQFGQQNIAKNDNIVNSDVYNNNKENRNINKQLLLDTRQQANDLKLNYQKQIDSLIKEKNNLPKNYITMKSNIQKQINTKTKELSDLLRANSSTITQLTQSITTQNKITQDDIEILDTKGYLPLVATINKWFGIDREIITLIIQSLFAIVFEITAIGLHVKSKDTQVFKKIKQPSKPLHATNTQDLKPKVTQENAPSEIKIVAKKQIGFSNTQQQIIERVDNKEAKKYIDKMYETEINGKPVGYKKLSRIAGLEEKVGKNVFEYLKFTKVIDTENGATKILKNRGEVNI